MKIAFLLVVFLGLVLADNEKNVQQTKSVSTESKNDVGAAQNAVVNPASQVVVHKREHHVRKHKGKKHKKSVKAILKSINKETLKRKKETINLGRELKLKILNVYRTSKMDITHLVKKHRGDTEELDVKQQLAASQEAAQGSAQVIQDLMNTTVTGLKKLVDNAATNVKDLAISFLGHIKEYANSNIDQMQAALDKGKMKNFVKKQEFKKVDIDKLSNVSQNKIFESYRIRQKQDMDLANSNIDQMQAALDKGKMKNFVKKQEFKKVDIDKLSNVSRNKIFESYRIRQKQDMDLANSNIDLMQAALDKGKMKNFVKKQEFKKVDIDKLSNVSQNKIFESYRISQKQVMDLAHTGADSILEAADREAKRFQVFTADDNKLQRYIKFVSKKIHDSAKDISKKYNELASGCLKILKRLALNVDKTVKSLAQTENQLGLDVLTKKSPGSKITETIAQSVTEFHDKNKHEFDLADGSITAMVNSVFDSASKQIDYLRTCSPHDPCVQS